MKHKVMNCKDWEPKKFKPGSLVSGKYDGVRGFYYPDKPYLISRDNKRLYGFDHIVHPLQEQNYSHVVDMELMIPGFDDWNKMAGAIRNHDQCPEAYALILDIPSMDIPFKDRINQMYEVSKLVYSLLFEEQIYVHTLDDVKTRW